MQKYFTSLGLWQRRDKLVEELIDLINATKVNKSEADSIKIQEYSKIQSIIKEQREIDPDWHLVIRQQGEGCLRVSHYDCYCNSGNDSKCSHNKVPLVKPRTLRDVTEIVKSVQETMNAININISFDENIATPAENGAFNTAVNCTNLLLLTALAATKKPLLLQ